MSIPRIDPEFERKAVDMLFEKRLLDALNVALSGQTALVIVPPFPGAAQFALGRLVQLVPEDKRYLVRMPGRELHFEGTRGSVRVYTSDHIEYRPATRQMLGYPAGIPTFLHPEVEGL